MMYCIHTVHPISHDVFLSFAFFSREFVKEVRSNMLRPACQFAQDPPTALEAAAPVGRCTNDITNGDISMVSSSGTFRESCSAVLSPILGTKQSFVNF